MFTRIALPNEPATDRAYQDDNGNKYRVRVVDAGLSVADQIAVTISVSLLDPDLSVETLMDGSWSILPEEKHTLKLDAGIINPEDWLAQLIAQALDKAAKARASRNLVDNLMQMWVEGAPVALDREQPAPEEDLGRPIKTLTHSTPMLLPGPEPEPEPTISPIPAP